MLTLFGFVSAIILSIVFTYVGTVVLFGIFYVYEKLFGKREYYNNEIKEGIQEIKEETFLDNVFDNPYKVKVGQVWMSRDKRRSQMFKKITGISDNYARYESVFPINGKYYFGEIKLTRFNKYQKVSE